MYKPNFRPCSIRWQILSWLLLSILIFTHSSDNCFGNLSPLICTQIYKKKFLNDQMIYKAEVVK